MGKKVALHNLGCKVNAYEVEAMQQLLEEAGYEIVPFEPGADVYLINTCTVTNIADRKSRQMLHKAKKMNPDAIVIAAGCYVQTDEGKLDKDEAVDLILGNNQKGNIVQVLEEYEQQHTRQKHVLKINQTKEYEELAIDHTAEHVRAYIKVQDGCNHFSPYCIIPYARGRVRSRKIAHVMDEVHALASKGYKEVVLTQNSKKKNFLHKADRQNMPVCFITGKIYRKQEYEIKTETDCKIVTVHSVHSNVAKIHSRLPAAMEFWLVCLGILAYSCQNTSRDSGV